MATEQKAFLKRLAVSWQKEFSFLKPVELSDVPQMAKQSTFICDNYAKSRGYYYFVRINFSPKRRGQFSIGITISPSPEYSILEQPIVSQLTPTCVGMFGIWKFLNRSRFDWALVDLEAEHNALFAQLGVKGINFGASPSPNVWRPSTYDQPLDGIINEAVAHVNHTLRTNVFPVLQFENFS